MSDEALGGWVVFGVIVAAVVGIGYWVADGIERNNVLSCLEEHSEGLIGGQDHVYMTDVDSIEVQRSFPNGEAVRVVKYRVSYDNAIQTAWCRW